MDNLIGRQIGNFRIDLLLGEGGMGAVYRATDMNLARPVALKVMHRQLANQPQFQRRFMQEAQAVARLSHPSIVTIHSFDHQENLFYIVMEFVQGVSLGKYIKQLVQRNQVVKLNETLTIVAQVADALAYAHRAGVVHRDIKPDNILIKKLETPEREGDPPLRAVVTDFGLAKLLEGGIDTQSGTFMGTLPYMSPEQALAKEIDGRSDIYSLGVVLYQLATGRLPFNIKSPTDAVMKHMNEVPPQPRSFQPGLPSAVEDVILKALAKEPGDRFQSGAEFATALRRAATGLSDSDVTAFATAVSGNMVSMITQIDAGDVPVPSRMDPDDTAVNREPRLIIAKKGETPETLPLTKASYLIGRASSNDIVISGDGVSRKHARLERTASGWQMTDLNSTNGTYVEGQKLLPDVPESLDPNQEVRIGPNFLRWQPPATAVPSQIGGLTYQATTPMAVPVGGSQIHSSTGQLSVVINPTNLDVAPGGRAEMQIELLNQGTTVDHFELQMQGIAPDWVTLPPEPLQLMPGTRGSLPVSVHPPQNSSARSGQHRYRLVVRSTSGSQENAAVSGSINVKPFTRFSVDMRPKQLKNKGVCRVLIRNEGNYDTTYAVIGRDPGEAVQFDATPKRVEVVAGERGTVDFTLSPKKRPFLGNKQMLPFEFQVSATDAPRQSLNGQLDVRPILPPWLPAAVVGLAVVLCLGAAALFAWTREQNANATATAVAAITQTAEYVAGVDDDGDGLTNQQEEALGLDPNNPDTDGDGINDFDENNGETDALNPDTDGDGLLDGDERNRGTNPLVMDTDGDTLSDGDEVNNIGSNPRAIDTDGDGQPDNTDPDPGQLPTATPTPTSTATATPTPVPDPPTETPTATPTVVLFTPGVWNGEWESECAYLSCGTVIIEHEEGSDQISGTFSGGLGRLTGFIEDNRVTGTWLISGESDTFDFWLADNGRSWVGNWGKTENWCGYRPGESMPEPCGVASWYGNWTTDCEGSTCGQVVFEQDGTEVVGTYANGDGTITGEIFSTTLNGEWSRGNGAANSINLFMYSGGRQFNGNFTGFNGSDTFAWCGYTGNVGLPDPCYNQGFILFAQPFLPDIIVTLQPILLPTATP